MVFIQTQKLQRDENNQVIGGYATVSITEYDPNRKHNSKHKVVAKLGKILYLSEDKKVGIFQSKTKGIVEYNAITDTYSEVSADDERLQNRAVSCPRQTQTVFGDTYLALKILEKSGMLDLFKKVFLKDTLLQRHLAHVLHGILRNGSKITCDNFIGKSFATHVLSKISIASLKSDSTYFETMGDDQIKLNFFREYIAFMRKNNSNFGRGCYVDSTPLPNDISDHPMNALSCHGINSSSIQMRLVLVLDEETGLPIWYEIIPGNVLDLSSLRYVIDTIEGPLDIKINSFVLDAGYTSKELIKAYHIGTEKTIISRMPQRKGYPYKTLYNEIKPEINKAKYSFVCQNHLYFGTKKERKIFDEKEYVYIYIDTDNANSTFKEFLKRDEELYDELREKDKDWIRISGGYFVLISNKNMEPKELLIAYHSRTQIESVFKTAKDYLGLLPLQKWTNQTVRGKILADIINTIVYLGIQQEILPHNLSMNELIGKTQSLMCSNIDGSRIEVNAPNKQTKEYYGYLGVKVPLEISLNEFRKMTLIGEG